MAHIKTMSPHQLAKTALTALLAYVALLALSIAFAEHYGRLALPLYQAQLDRLAPEYRTLSLSVDDRPGEVVFAWTLQTRLAIPMGGQVVPPGVQISSSTLLAHALQHPILVFSVVLAWPGLGWKTRLGALALALPWLVVVELLDVPLVLYGAIQDLLLANLAPAELDSSLAVQWMHAMNTGGRLALALAAGVMAVASVRGVRRLFDRCRRKPAGSGS